MWFIYLRPVMVGTIPGPCHFILVSTTSSFPNSFSRFGVTHRWHTSNGFRDQKGEGISKISNTTTCALNTSVSMTQEDTCLSFSTNKTSWTRSWLYDWEGIPWYVDRNWEGMSWYVVIEREYRDMSIEREYRDMWNWSTGELGTVDVGGGLELGRYVVIY
jgi:hypothetical protein